MEYFSQSHPASFPINGFHLFYFLYSTEKNRKKLEMVRTKRDMMEK